MSLRATINSRLQYSFMCDLKKLEPRNSWTLRNACLYVAMWLSVALSKESKFYHYWAWTYFFLILFPLAGFILLRSLENIRLYAKMYFTCRHFPLSGDLVGHAVLIYIAYKVEHRDLLVGAAVVAAVDLGMRLFAHIDRDYFE